MVHRRRAAGNAHAIFPMAYQSGWTTSTSSFPNIMNVPLTDNALGVNRVSEGTSHNIVQIGGKTAWEAFYPKGSMNPSSDIRGGFGFYLDGPQSWSIANAKEITFSYAVMFQSDFQWAKGGKLPGLFGGIGKLAYGCSGGRKQDRDKCFDLRYMWRTSGKGELYAYLPLNHPNTDYTLLAIPPYSARNADYGFSVGRGSWTFQAGNWNTMTEYVKLNTPGSEDGTIRVWWNGELVISAENIAVRDYVNSTFTGVHFQTFFGGSDSSWNSPQDQRAYFADISGSFIS
ncbi:polysaccharide lyase family 14 protein [Serendipita vermifera MAFF 305830]|uniref:Polysaccharide lyase family 14 protein n=1 Tax=Serendipita vermifera MAFF 305830 TaxID=933852 RepID=A0A0C3BAH4_SERVB|nr:polysaccharide lyase family 14 protein [Serendipita vermifera MAFF 305830]